MPLPIDPLRWRTLQEETPPPHRQFLVWANIDAPHKPPQFTKSQAFAVLLEADSRPGNTFYSYRAYDEAGRGSTHYIPEKLIQYWRPLGPLPPQ